VEARYVSALSLLRFERMSCLTTGSLLSKRRDRVERCSRRAAALLG